MYCKSMDATEKVREARLRRLAQRQGIKLVRSRRRDPQAADFGRYALVDPETKKGTRVGYRTEQVERDGRTRTVRVRVAKRSGKDI